MNVTEVTDYLSIEKACLKSFSAIITNSYNLVAEIISSCYMLTWWH